MFIFFVTRVLILKKNRKKYCLFLLPQMEQPQHQVAKDDGLLTLATRRCLFRLLSFLDSRLPECSAVNFIFFSILFTLGNNFSFTYFYSFIQIHSFVCAALITANPSCHIYFRKAPSPSRDENEYYSLIIGIAAECFIQPNQQVKVRNEIVLI